MIALRTRYSLRVSGVYGAKANYSYPDISVCRREPQTRGDLVRAFTRKQRRLTTVTSPLFGLDAFQVATEVLRCPFAAHVTWYHMPPAGWRCPQRGVPVTVNILLK